MAYPLETLLAQSLPLANQLSTWRRTIHRHPELGLQEEHTAQLIEAALDDLGIPHHRVGATGVLATITSRIGQGAPRVIALRADMDALPIQEVDDPARDTYRSRIEGCMHACGHDAHVAMLLGAAKLLAANTDRWQGEVRLIFQPAEEIGQGARPFVDEGTLDGVDRIFGLHAASDLPLGTICLKPGPNNASVDHFSIDVEGVSSHVAHPELGVDALYIGSQIVGGLQAITTRRHNPIEPLVIGIGVFHSGTAYNIVAPHAHIEGTTRTVSEQTRMEVRAEIERVAQSMAAAYGGTVSITWTGICAALVNDALPCAEASAVARALWGDAPVVQDRPQSMGGDNFADLMATPAIPVPGAYAFLGTAGDAVAGSGSAHHAIDFDIDERALPGGAAFLAGCALYHLGRS